MAIARAAGTCAVAALPAAVNAAKERKQVVDRMVVGGVHQLRHEYWCRVIRQRAPVKGAILVLTSQHMAADSQERFAPDAPFRFVGGDPCLDFINTADWTDRGLERDRFTGYERLVEWARTAGLVSASEARRLRQLANVHPRRATAAYESAIAARAVFREVVVAQIEGRPGPRALDQFNALLGAAAARLEMARGESGRLERRWIGFAETADCILWPVTWSASELLSSTDADKLRICGGRDCGWIYVDRSRNGLRRWCEMSVCGTAEKNRRRGGG